ncbi:hypothetical protein C7G83_17190 [Siccibacter turicensis]|uniref:Uncharacterized protein n=1 Tax=Siccibacter turicensis TaxID=357233 RepID=A0A2P8VFJ4_9ENTR|nr:hypothetical protein C7G83_17190 [Siccibacter turicensis]
MTLLIACNTLLRAKGSNFFAGGSSLRCVKHPVAGQHNFQFYLRLCGVKYDGVPLSNSRCRQAAGSRIDGSIHQYVTGVSEPGQRLCGAKYDGDFCCK